MNPNGMKAWRRFASGQRRKQNRANRASRAPWIADGTGRWYRRQQGFFKQRPSAPARAFSPRSLVGMSNGSRRRLCFALGYLIAVMCGGPARYTMQGVQAFGAWLWFKKMPGKRLRRCPGCVQCLVCVRCENEKCGKEHHRQTICNGSGVLPAGSEK